jgi:hypothetical protein
VDCTVWKCCRLRVILLCIALFGSTVDCEWFHCRLHSLGLLFAKNYKFNLKGLKTIRT